VVLYFYPKDDTPGCTKEACEFELLRVVLEQNNAVVLGVSRDSEESHQKFAGKYKLKFNLLSDPEHEVIESYGAWVEKSMFGKKYMGISRDTVLIAPDGKIHKIYRKVKPDSIAKEILEEVQKT
jgi:peroxiredoxin Q/BCP